MLIIIALLPLGLLAQNRTTAVETKLNALIPDIPALEEKIDISVSDVSIQEFIRGIASNSGLNINIDPSIKVRITNNYNQVRVLDILLFLCKEYNLEITNTGNILSLIPFTEVAPEKPKPVRKEPRIDYIRDNDLLSFDLYNDSLLLVVRKLTDLAQKNVIISPELNNQIVSGYMKNTAFDAALEKLAYTNRLSVTKTKDNFYIIEKADPAKAKETGVKSGMSGIKGENKDGENSGSVGIVFHSQNNFSVNCSAVPLSDLVRLVSDTLGINYSVIDNLEGNIDLNIENADYDEFLKRVFIGSPYSFKFLNGYYVIGKNDNALLKTTKIIKLQYRTVDKITELIPEDVAGKLTIKEFAEQNSLIVIGNPFQVQKIESFVSEIDRVVPLVLIELLIVEVNKTKSVTVGLNAGIKSNSFTGNKTISPSVDYDVSTQTINNILGKMNGFGWVNFGKVSPNFYLNIQALENDGKIVIRSTPKLATLNGHDANLSSGETKYYEDKKSNIIGTQNPTLSNSSTWTPIKADLKVTIKPFVSGDEQITLDVTVEQSQFTPREFPEAPPGSVTRKFQSLIRMKNQEMVLLGGLDKFSTTTSSQGLPLLARIPILKWLFGSNTNAKTDTKLSLFIQPTIIY